MNSEALSRRDSAVQQCQSAGAVADADPRPPQDYRGPVRPPMAGQEACPVCVIRWKSEKGPLCLECWLRLPAELKVALRRGDVERAMEWLRTARSRDRRWAEERGFGRDMGAL